jgi:hypothetical protein
MIAFSKVHWTRWLLLAVCVVNVARVLSVHTVVSRKPTPFLSANDRSRWSTIRTLGDDNTFIIDRVIFSPKTGGSDPKWNSIDKVRHKSSDGREHYFSSKPTLMLVLLAGLYKAVSAVTSWRLATDTFAVSQVMLLLVNVLPWAWICWRMLKWIEEETSDAFARGCLSVVAIAGTFLTTFVVTLNNHLHGAVGLVVLIDQARLAAKPGGKMGNFVAAGIGAGFLGINELPALSAITLTGALLLYFDWKKTLVGYAPPILLFAAAAIGSNYLAHGSWKTPYAHRSDGPVITTFAALLVEGRDGQELGDNVRAAGKEKGIEFSKQARYLLRPSGGWMIWDPVTQNRFAVRGSPDRAPNLYELRVWDNWYEYEGSYWLPGAKKGVDLGEPSIARYAFHCLVGHYGVFSLTPFWVCSIVGAGIWLLGADRERKVLAASIVLVTVVCLGFYIFRPLEDRNYGGVACGFRWAFWMIPAWILVAIPGADWLSKSLFGRALLVIFIVASVFFAWTNYANPWTHSWVYQMVVSRG